VIPALTADPDGTETAAGLSPAHEKLKVENSPGSGSQGGEAAPPKQESTTGASDEAVKDAAGSVLMEDAGAEAESKRGESEQQGQAVAQTVGQPDAQDETTEEPRDDLVPTEIKLAFVAAEAKASQAGDGHPAEAPGEALPPGSAGTMNAAALDLFCFRHVPAGIVRAPSGHWVDASKLRRLREDLETARCMAHLVSRRESSLKYPLLKLRGAVFEAEVNALKNALDDFDPQLPDNDLRILRSSRTRIQKQHETHLKRLRTQRERERALAPNPLRPWVKDVVKRIYAVRVPADPNEALKVKMHVKVQDHRYTAELENGVMASKWASENPFDVDKVLADMEQKAVEEEAAALAAARQALAKEEQSAQDAAQTTLRIPLRRSRRSSGSGEVSLDSATEPGTSLRLSLRRQRPARAGGGAGEGAEEPPANSSKQGTEDAPRQDAPGSARRSSRVASQDAARTAQAENLLLTRSGRKRSMPEASSQLEQLPSPIRPKRKRETLHPDGDVTPSREAAAASPESSRGQRRGTPSARRLLFDLKMYKTLTFLREHLVPCTAADASLYQSFTPSEGAGSAPSSRKNAKRSAKKSAKKSKKGSNRTGDPVAGYRRLSEHLWNLPNPDELPDYYQVIRDPLSFQDIWDKVQSGVYARYSHFEKDISKVVSNAKEFNEADTPVFKDAIALWDVYREREAAGREEGAKPQERRERPSPDSPVDLRPLSRRSRRLDVESAPLELLALDTHTGRLTSVPASAPAAKPKPKLKPRKASEPSLRRSSRNATSPKAPSPVEQDDEADTEADMEADAAAATPQKQAVGRRRGAARHAKAQEPPAPDVPRRSRAKRARDTSYAEADSEEEAAAADPESGSKSSSIGRRVAVFWPEDATWYPGVVDAFVEESSLHRVLYDDGEWEFLSLDAEKVKFV